MEDELGQLTGRGADNHLGDRRRSRSSASSTRASRRARSRRSRRSTARSRSSTTAPTEPASAAASAIGEERLRARPWATALHRRPAPGRPRLSVADRAQRARRPRARRPRRLVDERPRAGLGRRALARRGRVAVGRPVRRRGRGRGRRPADEARRLERAAASTSRRRSSGPLEIHRVQNSGIAFGLFSSPPPS